MHPDQKVWAFLGDGEMDEPESMGALTLASREELDNLIFVINCNLQRLDGPVRETVPSSRNWKLLSAAPAGM
jgi:pyruvate dehydrogenase E1 component